MVIDYLKTPWRSVPSIKSLWTDDAVDHCIVAAHPLSKSPVMVATNLPEEFAAHIVELHNASLK